MIKKGCFLLLLIFSFSASAQDTTAIKNFLLGKFDYKTAFDFKKVDKIHAVKPIYLNAMVYSAFKEMHAAAKNDGIELKILSGTRNFNEQKAIWERKWNRLDSLEASERAQNILKFSAMPGTSRHHWGTDIDLNSLENSYFEEGRGKAEYEWLVKNAKNYGFYQVYTARESGRTGYEEEKWHWSYLPLASQYLEQYLALIDPCEINGFEGSELAEATNIITTYVNGIPQDLRSSSLLAENSNTTELQKTSLQE